MPAVMHLAVQSEIADALIVYLLEENPPPESKHLELLLSGPVLGPEAAELVIRASVNGLPDHLRERGKQRRPSSSPIITVNERLNADLESFDLLSLILSKAGSSPELRSDEDVEEPLDLDAELCEERGDAEPIFGRGLRRARETVVHIGCSLSGSLEEVRQVIDESEDGDLSGPPNPASAAPRKANLSNGPPRRTVSPPRRM